MLIEGPRFSFKFASDISEEEWAQMAHAVCKIIVCGRPQPPQHRRAVAVRATLNLYSGSRFARAEQLAARYQTYLAGAWKREKALEGLPEPRSAERCLLHRIATLNAGRGLGWRQLLRIAGPL